MEQFAEKRLTNGVSIKKNTIMKRTIGSILAGGGLLGLIYFGYQYFQNSESFEAFGADVAVSTGNITPVIISGVVLVVGLVIARLK